MHSVRGEAPITADDSGGWVGRFSHAWRALRHRNFRLYFTGHSISLIGTWMARVAVSWLVYRLTGSALLLGVVGFAGQIPALLFAPFAGVLVERMDRRRLLMWTQTLAGMQALVLAALTMERVITIPEIIALMVFKRLINAFDLPGRQSFVAQLVDDKRDLGNAIVLNSSSVNVAKLIGPALAGLVIGAAGEGWCFAIDGVSYGAVVVALMMIRVTPVVVERTTVSMWEQMKEGWTYVTTFRPIRSILLLAALMSLMGMPFMVLMPIFASQVLHGGPRMLGFLTGTLGVGALVSAALMALRRSTRGLAPMIEVSAVMFGCGLILFGLSRYVWLSMALMLVIGFGMMQGLAASNTVIQTLVPEGKRARVMSYYTLAFVGTAPFGSLLAGVMADRVGAPRTVMITGAVCLAGAVWFSTQLQAVGAAMRFAYEEMEIPGEVEEGE
jgi:MFS family permease